MSRSLCDKVQASWSSCAAQQKTGPQGSPLADHLASCERCRAMVAQQTRLNALANEVQMDPILQRRIEVAVEAPEPAGSRGVFATRPKWAWAAVVAASIALASVLVWQGLGPSREAVQMPAQVLSEPSVRPAPPGPAPVISAGEHSRTVELRSGSTVWLKTGTSVQVLSDTKRLVKARLKRGRMVTRIGRQEKGFRFVVDTPSAQVTALGTVFSVEVSPDGTETVRVAESAVEVRRRDNDARYTVSAGQELVLGASAPRAADADDVEEDLHVVTALARDDEAPVSPPSKTASHKVTADLRRLAQKAIAQKRFDDAEWLIDKIESKLAPAEKIALLVRLARAYRQARQYEAAAKTYQRLGRAFPNSDAAMNGLVALAQIERRALHDPRTAIVHFDQYLAKRPYGSLAEAARVGKVRALYTLGRWKAVVKASDEYLQAHYGGLSTEEVQRKRDHAVRQVAASLR